MDYDEGALVCDYDEGACEGKTVEAEDLRRTVMDLVSGYMRLEGHAKELERALQASRDMCATLQSAAMEDMMKRRIKRKRARKTEAASARPRKPATELQELQPASLACF